MLIASTSFQLLVVLLLIVPGLVFAAVRRRLTGPTPEDREFSVRIGRALAWSVAFDGLYAVVAGPALVRLFTASHERRLGLIAHPRQAGAAALLALLVIPALSAVLPQLKLAQGKLPRVRVARQWVADRAAALPLRVDVPYSPAPNAWDHAARARGGCYVRIETGPGHFVGGWLAGDAYISSYPEPRDIFIDQEWNMERDGSFKDAVKGSLGIYVPLEEGARVSWMAGPDSGTGSA